LSLAACTAASLFLVPVSSGGVNPPEIEPWHKIGGVSLGMLRSAVEYRLGAPPDREFHYSYRVPGGTLGVGFAAVGSATYIRIAIATSRPTEYGVGAASR
jgi:hypothetical protein